MPPPPDNAKGAPGRERPSEPQPLQGDDQTASTVQRKRRKRRFPPSFGSRFRPDAERAWWHVTYRCGACGRYHKGQSPNEIKTGERRARCGRMTDLRIMRTYPGQGAL